jgi:hypothetical protein
MTWMFELYYALPPDTDREARLAAQVVALGGRLDFREEDNIPGVRQNVCLTFEFDDREKAEHAEKMLRGQGEHTEGVCEYG